MISPYPVYLENTKTYCQLSRCKPQQIVDSTSPTVAEMLLQTTRLFEFQKPWQSTTMEQNAPTPLKAGAFASLRKVGLRASTPDISVQHQNRLLGLVYISNRWTATTRDRRRIDASPNWKMSSILFKIFAAVISAPDAPDNVPHGALRVILWNSGAEHQGASSAPQILQGPAW